LGILLRVFKEGVTFILNLYLKKKKIKYNRYLIQTKEMAYYNTKS